MTAVDWVDIALPGAAAVCSITALVLMLWPKWQHRRANPNGTTVTDPNMAFTERKGTLTMQGQEYRFRRISATSAWIKPKRKRWWRR